MKKSKFLNKLSTFSIYFVLICIGFVYMQPIFTIISKTFMSAQDIIDPSVEWIPKTFSIENIKIASDVLNFNKTFTNTVFLSCTLAISQTIVSALTGFALSRYEFKFKKFWFVMIIVGFIIPVPVLMIPRLMLFVSVQEALDFVLIGSIIPQLSMSLLGQGIYSTVLILIFYNFFNLIPKSLDEAAMIDGATSLQTFYHVVIRLSMSTILVVFLFSLVWNWNETYMTSTLIRGQIETLPTKLALFDSQFEGAVSTSGGVFKLNEAYKMSATLLSIIPLLVLYSVVQKKFIQGIENTGITGE